MRRPLRRHPRYRRARAGARSRPMHQAEVAARATRSVLLAALVALVAAAWAALDPDRGGIALLLAAIATVAAGVAWLEGGPGSAKDLTLVATLAGLAAAGRVLFAPVPGVQPVTVIVAAAGAALGPRRGFAVGALAAFASNFFLGQGTHTPWQMLAWGGCGAAAGVGGRLLERRLVFAAFCFALGLAYGTLMDFWVWYGFWPHTSSSLLVVLGAGVAFNVAHAVGNLVLAFAAGPELRRVLTRHERRLRTEVVWT
jgi:energy-coupling factor transport system substrate-specific component